MEKNEDYMIGGMSFKEILKYNKEDEYNYFSKDGEVQGVKGTTIILLKNDSSIFDEEFSLKNKNIKKNIKEKLKKDMEDFKNGY